MNVTWNKCYAHLHPKHSLHYGDCSGSIHERHKNFALLLRVSFDMNVDVDLGVVVVGIVGDSYSDIDCAPRYLKQLHYSKCSNCL